MLPASNKDPPPLPPLPRLLPCLFLHCCCPSGALHFTLSEILQTLPVKCDCRMCTTGTELQSEAEWGGGGGRGGRDLMNAAELCMLVSFSCLSQFFAGWWWSGATFQLPLLSTCNPACSTSACVGSDGERGPVPGEFPVTRWANLQGNGGWSSLGKDWQVNQFLMRLFSGRRSSRSGAFMSLLSRK